MAQQQQSSPPTGPGRPAPPVHTGDQPRWPLDLAMIGNCSVSALIDGHGGVVWCCMPRFDGDPVFHALLGSADQNDGQMRIELEGLDRAEQAYDPGTAIVRTRLFDAKGQGLEI